MATISKRLLLKKDLLETLRFAFYADTDAFKTAFAGKGVLVEDEADLKALADLSSNGKDVNGSLSNNGKIIKFSVLDTLYNVDIRHDKLDKSGIKLVD